MGELKDYRKILEIEYCEEDLEIETTLSYITIGAFVLRTLPVKN